MGSKTSGMVLVSRLDYISRFEAVFMLCIMRSTYRLLHNSYIFYPCGGRQAKYFPSKYCAYRTPDFDVFDDGIWRISFLCLHMNILWKFLPPLLLSLCSLRFCWLLLMARSRWTHEHLYFLKGTRSDELRTTTSSFWNPSPIEYMMHIYKHSSWRFKPHFIIVYIR